VSLDLRERGRARQRVAPRLGVQPLAATQQPVAHRAPLTPRPPEGEIDVEDDRAEHALEHRSANPRLGALGGEPQFSPGVDRGAQI
jgi:hypothetical protein